MKLFRRQTTNQTDRRARNVVNRRETPSAGVQNRMFSYYANRSQSELNIGREVMLDKPTRKRVPGKLRQLRTHAALLFGAVFVLGVVIYNLQLSSQPTIQSLVSSTDAPFLQPSQTYQQAAEQLIRGSALNRNKLTINTSDITDKLRQQFPELQSVTVTVPLLGDRPVIYIRPADPAMVLAASSGTFLIDRQGRALSEAGSQSQLDALGIPTVTDQARLQIRLGDQVLSRDTAVFIATVSRQLQASDAKITAMILSANGSELDVYPAGKPYFVKYNLHAGAETAAEDAAATQTGSYLAVRKHLDAKRVVPRQYIDVRLAGRAYYK